MNTVSICDKTPKKVRAAVGSIYVYINNNGDPSYWFCVRSRMGYVAFFNLHNGSRFGSEYGSVLVPSGLTLAKSGTCISITTE